MVHQLQQVRFNCRSWVGAQLVGTVYLSMYVFLLYWCSFLLSCLILRASLQQGLASVQHLNFFDYQYIEVWPAQRFGFYYYCGLDYSLFKYPSANIIDYQYIEVWSAERDDFRYHRGLFVVQISKRQHPVRRSSFISFFRCCVPLGTFFVAVCGVVWLRCGLAWGWYGLA